MYCRLIDLFEYLTLSLQVVYHQCQIATLNGAHMAQTVSLPDAQDTSTHALPPYVQSSVPYESFNEVLIYICEFRILGRLIYALVKRIESLEG